MKKKCENVIDLESNSENVLLINDLRVRCHMWYGALQYIIILNHFNSNNS
jgi:hypothetical protein